jgi:hypothetical protein
VIAKKFEIAAIIVCFFAVQILMGKFFRTATRQKVLGEGKNFPAALFVEIEGSIHLR